jgi:hypothetical protein
MRKPFRQRSTTGGLEMKYAVCPALVVIWVLAASACPSEAADGCVAYGDKKTDFTWRLCPAGEKYERQYLYFGAWSKFHRVNSDAGACNWAAVRSSWVCPDRVISCDAKRCG